MTKAEQDDYIERILRPKLQSVEEFNLVLLLLGSPTPPESLEIYFDGRLYIAGSHKAFTNPVIEAGVIHCRALLEFIGLAVPRADQTKLIERTKGPSGDDVFIESFSLPRVTPDQAVSKYSDRDVAYRALARIISLAHKVLAHPTSGLIPDADNLHLLAVAGSGVPSLMTTYFYTPLGLEPPPSCITARRRPSSSG